jgi:hypothetical protein
MFGMALDLQPGDRPERRSTHSPAEALGRESEKFIHQIWRIGHCNKTSSNTEQAMPCWRTRCGPIGTLQRSCSRARSWASHSWWSARHRSEEHDWQQNGPSGLSAGRAALYEILDWLHQVQVETGRVASYYYIPHATARENLQAIMASD